MDPAGRTAFDAAYARADTAEPSWRESRPDTSLELLGLLGLDRSAPVADVGGGDSTLVDELLAAGFCAVTVVDLSATALARTSARLGADERVTLVHADVLEWRPAAPLGGWHDRACLHFVTDEADRARYVEVLAASLRAGGGVVVGCFAPDGPERCSGLEVRRAAPEELAELLGARFEVVEVRRTLHVTPGGATQPFSWVAALRAD